MKKFSTFLVCLLFAGSSQIFAFGSKVNMGHISVKPGTTEKILLDKFNLISNKSYNLYCKIANIKESSAISIDAHNNTGFKTTIYLNYKVVSGSTIRIRENVQNSLRINFTYVKGTWYDFTSYDRDISLEFDCYADLDI